ncbi:hypothetical protein ACFZB4_07635 [Streptomyces pseudovenezuelae]|uniref:hypothetical protein n=1 Tax=Streptomyces pseudovenezuelae TaxID=67350 RepID=UPI0036ED4349
MAITCVGGAESVRGVRIRGMVREVAERAEVGKATAYGGHPAREDPVAVAVRHLDLRDVSRYV